MAGAQRRLHQTCGAAAALVAMSACATADQREMTHDEMMAEAAKTEAWSPEPVRVAAPAGAAPADATVLFDGTHLDAWVGRDGGPAAWTIADGAFTVAPGTGDISTVEMFGDVQLHIEWRTPLGEDHRTGQDKGNSGVFLQDRYEVQVLDSYANETYANGQAGAIYKQHIPLVNASRPPGAWQTYDIIYTAPRFEDDGALASPARMTVLHNGVMIHNNAALSGDTVFIGRPRYTAHGPGPIKLQDHSNPVSYRNIWVRRLD